MYIYSLNVVKVDVLEDGILFLSYSHIDHKIIVSAYSREREEMVITIDHILLDDNINRN